MNWKHLSTSQKLNLSFGLMAVMILFAGWQGISGLSRLNDEFQVLYRVHTLGLASLKAAQLNLHEAMFNIHRSVHLKDLKAVAANAEDIQNHRDSLEKKMVEFQNTAVTEKDKKLSAQVINSLQTLGVEQDAVLSALLAGKPEQSRQSLVQAQSLAALLFTDLNTLESSKHEKLEAAAAQAEATYHSVRMVLFTVVALSFTMAFAFGYLLSRLITNPLRQTAVVLEAVAQGDFTRSLEFESHDELGQMARALNRAVQGIRKALEEVREASVQVADASRGLAHSSDQLARGVQNQAASLDESAASLEEMTATVRQNADNARRASKLAEEARDCAEEGGGVVSRAVGAMNEINVASRRIADIITAIDEIAFQTNLLALNAAVEAARAGEQGRGFAVVAAEVRSLAQRSATAAREIKSLIQDSLAKVQNGSALVNQSGHTLEQIVQSVKVVTDIVGEIAAASQEQATGLDQVNRAVVQMDQVTQANANHTEDLTSTARTLADSAQHVRGLVARFRLEAPGSSGFVAPLLEVESKPAKASTVKTLQRTKPTAQAVQEPVAEVETFVEFQ
jgi:methyl-accepting chemotaxis protein